MLLWIFLSIHAFLSPVISSNILHYFNNVFHEFQLLKKVITTETFNIDFHNKFIRFWIILLFQLFYIYVCVNIFPRLITNFSLNIT